MAHINISERQINQEQRERVVAKNPQKFIKVLKLNIFNI